MWEKLKNTIRKAEPYYRRYITIKFSILILGAAGITTGSAIIGYAIIFWYALSNNLPLFECLDAFEGRSLYFSIATFAMITITVIFLLSAGLFRLKNPNLPSFLASDEAERKKAVRWNWISWRLEYLPAFIAYSIIGLILTITHFDNLKYAVGFTITSTLSVIFYYLAILQKRRTDFNVSWGTDKWSVWLVTLILLLLTFIATLAQEGRFRSAITRDFSSLENAGEVVELIYINAAGVIAFIVGWWLTYIIQNKNRKHLAIIVGFIGAVLVGYWPGFSAFVDAAFKLYKVGGPIEISMYVEPTTGCEALKTLKGIDCEKTERNIFLSNVNLLLRTRDKLYFSVPTKNGKRNSVLVLDTKSVNSIIYH